MLTCCSRMGQGSLEKCKLTCPSSFNTFCGCVHCRLSVPDSRQFCPIYYLNSASELSSNTGICACTAAHADCNIDKALGAILPLAPTDSGSTAFLSGENRRRWLRHSSNSDKIPFWSANGLFFLDFLGGDFLNRLPRFSSYFLFSHLRLSCLLKSFGTRASYLLGPCKRHCPRSSARHGLVFPRMRRVTVGILQRADLDLLSC